MSKIISAIYLCLNERTTVSVAEKKTIPDLLKDHRSVVSASKVHANANHLSQLSKDCVYFSCLCLFPPEHFVLGLDRNSYLLNPCIFVTLNHIS